MMDVNKKAKLNKAKVAVMLSNVVAFGLICANVLAWLGGDGGFDGWALTILSMLTIAVAWVPLVNTAFLIAFLYSYSNPALLDYLVGVMPAVVFVGTVLLFPHRVSKPSQL